MGFIVGILAALVGLTGAYFAAELVSLWLGAVFLAVVAVGFGIPMHRFGHRQFKGGGNTDFWLYFMVFGIILALAVPRYNRARACKALGTYAGWLESAQTAYQKQHGRFAVRERDLTGLPPDAVAPSSSRIRITLDSAAADSFAATLTHESCPESISLEIPGRGSGKP